MVKLLMLWLCNAHICHCLLLNKGILTSLGPPWGILTRQLVAKLSSSRQSWVLCIESGHTVSARSHDLFAACLAAYLQQHRQLVLDLIFGTFKLTLLLLDRVACR